MWEEVRIVIVDNDQRRRDELRLVFEFIGEPVRCFSYAEWQQAEVQTSAYRENLSLLVLAQDQQPLVEHLQCAEQWQSGLPIMIVDYDLGRRDVLRLVFDFIGVPVRCFS